MVTRQNSTSYPVAPTAPPPPPPPANFAPSNVDASNVTRFPPKSQQVEEDSPYRDMGNPWADVISPTDNAQNTHPNILRPGVVHPTSTTDIPDIPDVMKPGWSGQNTPRSSMDSDRSKDFWESSDDEEDGKAKGKEKGKGKGKDKEVKKAPTTSSSTEDLVIPSPLQIKRKPVPPSPSQESNPIFDAHNSQSDFASNNPFRRPSSSHQQLPDTTPLWGSDIKGKGKESDPHPLTEFANLSLKREEMVHDAHPVANLQEPSFQWQQQQLPPQPQAPPPPPPIPKVSSPFSEQPPLIPVSPRVEEPANPWSVQQSISAVPSPIPFAPSQKQNSYSTEDLLDRGQKADGRISLGDELKALPNAVQPSTSQQSLLDDDLPPPPPPPPPQLPRPVPASLEEGFQPPPGPPPSHLTANQGRTSSSLPPSKPPRPAVVIKPLTDSEIAQIQEQRNETYQIKHFNWFDHRSGNLRTSSMLTQNKNGPCPLLALVNALILGFRHESQAALDDALRPREQVTLGLIIETLMDEMLSSSAHLDGDLPDVDELNKFLMKLRTGMNMNPRFVQPQAPAPNLMDTRNSILHMPTPQARDQPGNFESTQDIRLYSTFGVKTVHGWLPEPKSEAVGAFARSAQNYEDAQVIQFGEEELDYKLRHGGLTPQEEQLWGDIVSIKDFFHMYPTLLSPYGLSCIKNSMEPGSFAILFRNDHFSTIYKHPRDGKLYTLITDAGYADRDEIIWESLVDISGQQSEFFSGDFQSVSHQVDTSQRRSDRLSADPSVPEPLSPQQQQEQHDADFAMALQLQEEEEQRMREERNNRSGTGNTPAGRGGGAPVIRGGGAPTNRGGSTPTNRGGSTPANRGGTARRGQGIPIPLRNNNSGTENRPLIPPRNQRTVPAVNRPSDALEADAPPTYEEAARGKPYNPPLGSPLHPQSSASAEPSPYNSTSNINLPEAIGVHSNDPPPTLTRPERRRSAYNENLERYGHSPHSPRSSSGRFEMGTSPAYSQGNTSMPGTYIHTGRGGHGQGVSSGPSSARRRNEDGDCVVM